MALLAAGWDIHQWKERSFFIFLTSYLLPPIPHHHTHPPTPSIVHSLLSAVVVFFSVCSYHGWLGRSSRKGFSVFALTKSSMSANHGGRLWGTAYAVSCRGWWCFLKTYNNKKVRRLAISSISPGRGSTPSASPEVRGKRCCRQFQNGRQMFEGKKLDIYLFHPSPKKKLQLRHLFTFKWWKRGGGQLPPENFGLLQLRPGFTSIFGTLMEYVVYIYITRDNICSQ